MKRRWTEADLVLAVKKSSSIRQVIYILGLKPAGGNYSQVQGSIKNLGLSTDHFKGQGWNKGLRGLGHPRISLVKILTLNSNFQSHKLKKRLFGSGLKVEQCEECGWAERSEDGRIPLELDHINGNNNDNRLENLRILCPNCHSLRPTHRGRNIGRT